MGGLQRYELCVCVCVCSMGVQNDTGVVVYVCLSYVLASVCGRTIVCSAHAHIMHTTRHIRFSLFIRCSLSVYAFQDPPNTSRRDAFSV